MRIMSQDKALLADYAAVYIDDKDGTIQGDIAGVTGGCLLGHYADRERAKNVLHDISILVHSGERIVYMPKE